jgi:hypothetical protein
VALLSSTNPQFLEFDIANAALMSAVFEFVRLWQSKLLSDEVMTDMVLRVTRKVIVLLLVEDFL